MLKPRIASWFEELLVRQQLGGYCPDDPVKRAFFSSFLAAQIEKQVEALK